MAQIELGAMQGDSTDVPQVSIGMPVHNGELFIREALDSLLGQTFVDFELIISDNASTDRTEAICLEYAEKDYRIRYVRQIENMGALNNFKFVLNEAVGKYFLWAAHDDRRDKRFLELTVSVLDEQDEVGLVFSEMHVTDLVSLTSYKSSFGYSDSNNLFCKYLFRLSQCCPNLIYGLHRASVLRRASPSILSSPEFDYSDVSLTHWYELNSKIKVIPLALFTAGENGKRIPYGLNSKFISNKLFFKNEKALLRSKLSFAQYIFAYLLLKFQFGKNTRRINQIIKLHSNISDNRA